MAEFETGDQVELKSGGPVMTVSEKRAGFDAYECQWFSGNKLNYGYFQAGTISHVKGNESRSGSH